MDWRHVPFAQSYDRETRTSTSTWRRSRTRRSGQVVDFSNSYYFVNQALVGREGTAIASAKSRRGTSGRYRLGAQLGTTSYQYIVDYIRPISRPLVYDSNDLAVQALKNGQIDGIVVDFPTAFFVTAVQVDDGVIVGRFPNRGGRERFGHGLREGQLAPAMREPRAQPPLGERDDQADPEPLSCSRGAGCAVLR